MAEEITRIEEQTMDEAVDAMTQLPGVADSTVQGVWATFRCSDGQQFDGAVQTALKQRGVVLHKAERQDGFVSIALEDYAEEL